MHMKNLNIINLINIYNYILVKRYELQKTDIKLPLIIFNYSRC